MVRKPGHRSFRIIAFLLLFFFSVQLCQGLLSLSWAREQGLSRPPWGNFHLEERDIVVPQEGFDLAVVRTYNSRSRYRGLFGWGWQSSLDLRLFAVGEAKQVFLIDTDGAVIGFTFDPGLGVYTSKRGGWQTLRRLADGTWVRVMKGGRQHLFDKSGRLVRMADLNGNGVVFTYGADGRLQQAATPSGQTLRLIYDRNGNIARIDDPLGRAYRYELNDSGDLVKVTDPAGRSNGFRYDQFHNLTEIRYADGSAKVLTYDGRSDLLLSENGPGAYRQKYMYDPDQRTVSITDGTGGTTRIAYSRDLKKKEVVDPVGGKTVYEYREDGLLAAVHNPLGQRTLYEHDARGNVVRTVDAMGGEERTEYHPTFNLPVALVNQMGRRTQIRYDGKGNLTDIIQPDGGSISFARSQSGRISEFKDQTGHRTLFSYDRNGYAVRASDDLGTILQAVYDAAGRKTSVAGPDGLTLSFLYSPAGRVTAMFDRSGRTFRYEYDAMDRVTGVTDPAGSVTRLTYDAAGHVTAVENALGGKTLFSYDAMGRLTQVTDPKGNISRYVSDAAGRMTEKIDAKGNRFRWAHDTAGRISSYSDALGQTVKYKRDALGRIVEKEYPDGNHMAFTYDATGKVTAARGLSTSLYMAYDAMQRVVTRQDGLTGSRIDYAYDGAGRVVRKMLSGTQKFLYGYDGRGRTTSIVDPKGLKTEYRYDAASRRSVILHPNGMITRLAYDKLARLSEIRHEGAGGKLVARAAYTSDLLDRRVWARLDGKLTGYAYDALGQLTRESVEGGESLTYVYDPAGNRVEKRGKEALSYEYDTLNRVVRAGDARFTYDANGRLVEKTAPNGQSRYRYDVDGHLTAVETPNKSIYHYAYDGFGRRVRWSGPEGTRLCLYDEEDALAEFSSERKISRLYVHGPDTDEVVGVIEAGDRYSVHQDGLGSAIAVLDHTQQVASRYAYNAFGDVTAVAERVELPFLFAGARYDRETRFHYLRTRAYDPGLGRFVSPDTVDILGGVNLYRYVNNDPVNNTDPTGEFIGTIAGTLIGGAVGAIRAAFWDKKSSGEIWAAAKGGAVSGFISGAFVDVAVALAPVAAVGATAAAGAVILASMVGGGIGSFSGNWLEQYWSNQARGMNSDDAWKKVNRDEALLSGLVGGCVSGAMGGAIGAVAGEAFKESLKETGKKILITAATTLGIEIFDEYGSVTETAKLKAHQQDRKDQEYYRGQADLQAARELIAASKTHAAAAQSFIKVAQVDMVNEGANGLKRAEAAREAAQTAYKASHGAEGACRKTIKMSDIERLRKGVLDVTADLEKYKGYTEKARNIACTQPPADPRSPGARPAPSARAKEAAQYAQQVAAYCAKQYAIVKRATDMAVNFEGRIRPAMEQAQSARASVDAARKQVEEASADVSNRYGWLKRNRSFTEEGVKKEIKLSTDAKNGALNKLTLVQGTIVPNLEGDQQRSLVKEVTTLLAEVTAITIPTADGATKAIAGAETSFQKAEGLLGRARLALEAAQEKLLTCEDIGPVYGSIREVMGANDAAHRSMQLIWRMMLQASDCAGIPAPGEQTERMVPVLIQAPKEAYTGQEVVLSAQLRSSEHSGQPPHYYYVWSCNGARLDSQGPVQRARFAQTGAHTLKVEVYHAVSGKWQKIGEGAYKLDVRQEPRRDPPYRVPEPSRPRPGLY